MPSKVQKKRAQNKKYYKDHKEKLSLQACENYAANSDVKKCASKEYFEAHKEQRLAYHSKYYDTHQEERKAYFSVYYESHKEEGRLALENITLLRKKK